MSREVERREFLRKAAATGVAAAWAAPIVQTVAARPAFAQNGTPPPCPQSDQDHSCMERCQQSGNGGCGAACGNQCQPACEQGVCPEAFCDPNCWDNCNFIC